MYFKVSEIINIVKVLRTKNVGIFPFDTILGLTSVIDKTCIDRISRIKKRSQTKPLIVMLPNKEQLGRYVEIPDFAQAAVAKYWPGPVTFIFKKKGLIPDYVTNGLSTVGIRIPSFWPLNLLLDELGQPLVSTSVNFSGNDPVSKFEEIPEEIKSQVDFICDAFLPEINIPSVLVDCSGNELRVLRGRLK
jgi:L-threonylcarbamoyladenylate synthase